MNKENIKLFFKGFIKVFKPFFIIIIFMILFTITFNLFFHRLSKFGDWGIVLSVVINSLIYSGIIRGIVEVERNKSIDGFNNRHNSSRPRVHKK